MCKNGERKKKQETHVLGEKKAWPEEKGFMADSRDMFNPHSRRRGIQIISHSQGWQ